jgi:hypothetical protein
MQNNTKTSLLVLLFCCLAVGGYIVLEQKLQEAPVSITDAPLADIVVVTTTTAATGTVAVTSATNTPLQIVTNEPLVTTDWETVVNKKYGFSYRVPTASYEFYIDVYSSDESLRDYAQNIWIQNKYDTNPNIKDKTVSDVKEVQLGSQTAYQFTLSKSFTWSQGGYVLNEPFVYTFLETKNKTKIVARVPVADRYRDTILNSLVVADTLIPANETPANWKVVTRDEYEFTYPANLFVLDDTYTKSDKLYLADIAEGMRGGVMVSLLQTEFDPENIIDMYGIIENPEKIVINDIVWYSYLWGDAGASARLYLTDLPNGKTLKISFASMAEEAVYPIVTDSALQRAMLNTFVK